MELLYIEILNGSDVVLLTCFIIPQLFIHRQIISTLKLEILKLLSRTLSTIPVHFNLRRGSTPVNHYKNQTRLSPVGNKPSCANFLRGVDQQAINSRKICLSQLGHAVTSILLIHVLFKV